MKNNEQKINGTLRIHLYAHPTEAMPNHNDSSTERRATVIGLDAARAWLDANGGYAKLTADHSGPSPESSIRRWEIVRVFAGYGHRTIGDITPAAE